MPFVRQFDDVVMVHAGLHPTWDDARLAKLTPEDVDYAVNVRYCDADGNLPPDDWPPPGPPFQTKVTGRVAGSAPSRV